MKEAAIQVAVCRNLEARGVPGLVWFHVPNGGLRDAVTAARLKAQGVKAGVSDFLLFRGEKAYALELKALWGRLSPAQEDFLDDFRRENGGRGFVCYGLDDALNCLKKQGLIR